MKRFAAVLSVLAFMGSNLVSASSETPRPAPKLVYNIPGKEPQSLSQYLGKVVALEFIFTTCPHCKAASKVMSKMQTEYGPRGFQVLDIAVNDNADLKVDDFAKEQQTTFPVGWVPQADMVSFMGFSSARFVVPQLVLIDRKGIIHYQTPALEDEKWDQLMSDQALRKKIEELLQSGSAASSHGAHSKTLAAKKSE